MSERRFLSITISSTEEEIDTLKQILSRNGQKMSASEAVTRSMAKVMAEAGSVKVTDDDRRVIASRAGLNDVPKTSEQILSAFFQAADLDEYSAIVRLDPGVAGELHDLAMEHHMGFSEFLTHSLQQATLDGYISGNVKRRCLFFDDQEWQRLLTVLEVTQLPTGADLLKTLMAKIETSVLG